MLEHMLKWLDYDTPVFANRWNSFVSVLKLNANRYRSRFINDQYMTNSCTRLFEQLLMNVPVDKFITDYPDDYNKLTNISDDIVRNIAVVFDPVLNLKNSCNIISKSSGNVIPEYYLNVSCDKPFTYMPVNKSWEYWNRLKAVRILYHDSRELCTDLLSMDVNFKKLAPSHMVISIDIPALIMQYIKFIEHHNVQLGGDLNHKQFIKYNIIEPWHDDLMKTWLFNVFQDVVYDDFRLFKLHNSHNIISKGRLKAAKTALTTHIGMLKNKQININRLLSATWMGNVSVMRHMKSLEKIAILPDFSQYEYLKFLMEFPYIKLIVHLCLISKSDHAMRMLRELKYKLNLYVQTNVAQKILNSNHRLKVMEDIRELKNMLKNV